MRAGRPSKLTPETQEKLCQAIQLGATYELACQYAGIAYNTFNEWMKAGAVAQNGRFYDFYEAIQLAEGRAAIGWLAKIEKAANDGDWQAAKWKLSARYPEQYGRTVTDNRQSGTINLVSLSDEELDDLAKKRGLA